MVFFHGTPQFLHVFSMVSFNLFICFQWLLPNCVCFSMVSPSLDPPSRPPSSTACNARDWEEAGYIAMGKPRQNHAKTIGKWWFNAVYGRCMDVSLAFPDFSKLIVNIPSISLWIDFSTPCQLFPFGNQTWLARKSRTEWKFLARKITCFYGPFSSQPWLITRALKPMVTLWKMFTSLW